MLSELKLEIEHKGLVEKDAEIKDHKVVSHTIRIKKLHLICYAPL